MTIRLLSETIAAQIAAGEVVERPTSVVKELLENALDADARNIAIEIREGGHRLIRVSDDGQGIPSHEVAVAFMRHSTSKLVNAADLDAIYTLGFRGEALASIASVAYVTMATRTTGETAGTRLYLEGGKVVSQEKVGAPRGTVVGVENLFYNVPARRKFLRSQTTEKRNIDALVTRYALAYPNVRFRLTQDNRIVFQSPGSGMLLDVLIEVFGIESVRQMLAIGEQGEWELPASDGRDIQSGESNDPMPEEIEIWGFTGSPSLNRANRTHITFFINGRWVQDRSLTYAVVKAYHTLLMSGRYPVSVIMVKLPADWVDVNVHPTKAEVRFRDKDRIFRAIQRAVRNTLIQSSPTATPIASTSAGEEHQWVVPGGKNPLSTLASLQPVSAVQPEMVLPGGTAGERVQIDSELSGDSLFPADHAGQNRMPILRIVGQVGASFIVAEGPKGMVLIDQHAAHERVLYEQFMAQRDTGITTQQLLEPVPVELTPESTSIVEEQIDLLKKLGFDLDFFGGNTILVRGLPVLIGTQNPTAAINAVIDDLEMGDEPLLHTTEEKIIARVCKNAAVKAGQVLTMQEMVAMIRQLEASTAPFTCPHGRPTMIEMPSEHLARQFKRK